MCTFIALFYRRDRQKNAQFVGKKLKGSLQKRSDANSIRQVFRYVYLSRYITQVGNIRPLNSPTLTIYINNMRLERSKIFAKNLFLFVMPTLAYTYALYRNFQGSLIIISVFFILLSPLMWYVLYIIYARKPYTKTKCARLSVSSLKPLQNVFFFFCFRFSDLEYWRYKIYDRKTEQTSNTFLPLTFNTNSFKY